MTPSSGFSGAAVGRFFRVSFPTEVYRARAWVLGVAAGFVLVAGVLITMVANDPGIALSFMSQDDINELVSRSFASYYSQNAPQNFAAVVWTNNAFISAVCLAGGVLILPTLYMLFQNVFNVGLIGGVMVGAGRSDVFFGLILVHGMLELTCIFVAAGVGLRIGWAWIAPGPFRTRTQAVAQTGRSAMVVALGLAVPLFVSGLVEAFVTPSLLPTWAKLGVGALVWVAFVAYVVGSRPGQRAERADRRCGGARAGGRGAGRLNPSRNPVARSVADWLEAAGGLEVQVRVRHLRREILRRRVDDVDAVAAQRGPDPVELGEAALGRGRGVERVGVTAVGRPARRGRGRARRRRRPCGGRPGSAARAAAPRRARPASSVVKMTTSARLRSSVSTSVTTRPKSVSTSAGCERRQRLEQLG